MYGNCIQERHTSPESRQGRRERTAADSGMEACTALNPCFTFEEAVVGVLAGQFWQFYRRSDYITARDMDAEAARDIRLFGIASRFRDLFDTQLHLFDDRNSAMERALLMTDLPGCELTMLCIPVFGDLHKNIFDFL